MCPYTPRFGAGQSGLTDSHDGGADQLLGEVIRANNAARARWAQGCHLDRPSPHPLVNMVLIDGVCTGAPHHLVVWAEDFE